MQGEIMRNILVGLYCGASVAQRRSESLQDVPVSVNALSADALKNQQVNTLDQCVGTLANNVSVESSVVVAVDEVSIGQPAKLIDVFNDIERVNSVRTIGLASGYSF
jgi:outer membrane receptor protein involved in Fe transport